MTSAPRSARVQAAIEKAIPYIRLIQERTLRDPRDRGGWRYIRSEDPGDSEWDLSVTSWQIMFLRSAHNAGFDVPKHYIDEATTYVRSCYQPHSGEFLYGTHGKQRRTARGMTGAGVLCLFLTGNYDGEIETKTGNWLLNQSFERYNTSSQFDHYFYAAYYCSQAAHQLGGDYWGKTYPPLAATLVANQGNRGNWDPESTARTFGPNYSTAMAILTLTPPFQLLPIYQR